MEWQPIDTAPFECDLELAVLERNDVCALVSPPNVPWTAGSTAETKQRIEVQPPQISHTIILLHCPNAAAKKNPRQITHLGFPLLLPLLGFFDRTAGVLGDGVPSGRPSARYIGLLALIFKLTLV